MASDADLEAAIDVNPDDVEAYHVYGDWLQAQGDPRGELVALQAALYRDPSDKKLAQRIDRYIDKHTEALLGPLRRHQREGLTLVWRHGFIRDAHLGMLPADLEPALRDLLRHPSSRFLISLTFAHKAWLDTVIAVLLDEKRPPTLGELRVVGDDIDEAQLERLRAVFPRINRSVAVEWRRIMDLIGKQPRLDMRFDPEDLPALVLLPDVTVGEIDMTKLLRGLRHEVDKGRELGVVAAMKRTFTADSLEQFVLAMGKQHVERSLATSRWVLRALELFGGVRVARWIGESMRTWGDRAERMIGILRAIGTEYAVIQLVAIAGDPALEHVQRQSARWALFHIAGNHVEELIDRSVPAELDARERDALVRRFHEHMLDGRRISEREFRRHVATHPAVAPLAERLVWATYVGDRIDTFRITGERTIDVDGKPVALAGPIGIVHPAELAAEAREKLVGAWREAFEALEIEPLFEQLARPVHRLAADTIAKLLARRPGAEWIRSALSRRRNWSSFASSHWEKRCERGGEVLRVTVGTDAIVELPPASTLSALHPVELSELLADLEAATNPSAATGLSIGKGARVRIVRGKAKGAHGEVFWLGDNDRCGVRGDEGETHWLNLDAVVLQGAPEPDAAPSDERSFERGDTVRWKKGKQHGTGTVFWYGKNKFGDGMRVGIKDEQGETIWANADDCEVVT